MRSILFIDILFGKVFSFILDYYSVVNDSIASFNEQCTLEITKASKQLYDLSKTEGGCQIINDMFR